MNIKILHHLGKLTPFLILGLFFTITLGLLAMLSYLLIWGLVLGFTAWIISLLKKSLFSTSKIKTNSPSKKEGRIIEHADL